jgi:CheY-like chemotaxis protein
MTPFPRILTVDPTGGAAELVRAALRLLERPAIQVDVPGGVEAFDEVERGHLRLLVTAYDLASELDGLELARHVRQRQPETNVILLAGRHDSLEHAELEMPGDGGAFVVLRQPVEPHQLLRILVAALDGRDVLSAAFTAPHGVDEPAGAVPSVPRLDLNAASRVLDSALTDVGAMAVVLSSRTGEVLLERGAVGYLDREQLTLALTPTVNATIDMTRLIGGRPAALLYYDGEHYDVFVLSVGLHHFLVLVFDGQNGLRSYGAVNRYGRRASEDLIALIGASALILEAEAPEPVLEEEAPAEADEPPEQLLMAELPPPPPAARKRKTSVRPAVTPPPEPTPEPASDFDSSILLSLFNADDLQALEDHALDDLFNPERLAEIASETRRESGPLSYEEARELGLIP